MPRTWLTSLLLTCLLVAACSSGGSADAPTTDSTQPAEPTTSDASAGGDLRVISLNALHGLFLDGNCPPETDSCAAPARIDLLWEAIEEAGCPDVIALQEIGPAQRDLLPGRIPDLCSGAYSQATEYLGLPVEVAVLTTLPVAASEGLRLSGINWAAQWVSLESEVGRVDVVTAHFASSADPFPCEGDYCRPGCPEGAMPGDCHPEEVLELLASRSDDSAIQIITGDLNRPIDDPRVATLTGAGFVDVWTLAGNPECDPATGEGCTCCVAGPPPLGGLDTPDQKFSERIDFVLVRAPADCELALDGAADNDGDGTGTGPFATEPARDPISGIYWPSDHGGVQADLSCGAPT